MVLAEPATVTGLVSVAAAVDTQPAKLGFWLILSVFAQCEGFCLESQACLPYLSEVGTEYADQAEKADQTRQTGDTSGTVNNQRNLVNGLYA